MSSIADISAAVDTLTTELQTIKLKLDDIAAFVALLKAGSVSQADIDALAKKVASTKEVADTIATEADSIS